MDPSNKQRADLDELVETYRLVESLLERLRERAIPAVVRLNLPWVVVAEAHMALTLDDGEGTLRSIRDALRRLLAGEIP